jgi:hypothetical protein
MTHACMRVQEGLHQEGREARNGDLIISGDLDEVPKPEAVAALRRCHWGRQAERHNCASLESSMYYFSYANYAGGAAALNMHPVPYACAPRPACMRSSQLHAFAQTCMRLPAD